MRHTAALLAGSLVLGIPSASAQELYVGQDMRSPPSSNSPLVVSSGHMLRCRLDRPLRITEPGKPVSSVLAEPLYVGKLLAVPEGTVVKGHVASIETVPLNRRKRRLIGGDFTPLKIAHVAFDQLVLLDGTTVPIRTDAVVGAHGVQVARYIPNARRSGLRQILAAATKPLREPHKLQRLGQAAVVRLPYHPQFLDRGTIFDAILLTEFTTVVPVQPTGDSERLAAANLLCARLSTPSNSSRASQGTAVEAVVVRPHYGADGALWFPAGTRLDGTVSRAVLSGPRKKGGALLFTFYSARTPEGAITRLSLVVAGIQAAHGQTLSVDREGEITSRNPPVGLIVALTSLAVANAGVNKTVLERAGQGASGFGLVGAGAAQASASTAAAFGIFGAATRLYDAFLARGSDIELPVNTPLLLRVDQARQRGLCELAAECIWRKYASDRLWGGPSLPRRAIVRKRWRRTNYPHPRSEERSSFPLLNANLQSAFPDFLILQVEALWQCWR